MPEGYDRGQVCRRGHAINGSVQSMPQFNKAFCPKCGSKTIDACEHCAVPIQGDYRGSMSLRGFQPAAYCHSCGKQYPWTELRLQSISELLGMTEATAEEKAALSTAVPSLASDSPDTAVAVAKWQKFLKGSGKQMTSAFRELFVDIAGEAVKRALWPSG